MALGNDVTLKVGFDIDKFQAELRKTNGILNNWGTSVNSTITKAFGAFAVIDIGKQMIEVTSQFQKFEAILTNTLGSNSKAQQALSDIKKFAISTPFEVSEITAAYVRWANMGLTPTIDRMRKLGDVASSLGAGFEQTAEAFKDLMVGQTKRIEEVGISATQMNGKIQLSFKGVNLEIEKNAEGVQKALEVFSQLNGVLGTSDAIAKTLGGQILNLSDAWTNFLDAQGTKSTGIISYSVKTLTNLLNGLAKPIENLPPQMSLWDKAMQALGIQTDGATKAMLGLGNGAQSTWEVSDETIKKSQELAEKLAKEKAAAEKAAKAYNELFHSKAKAAIAIPEGTTALQNATIPQPGAMPGKVGSPFGDIISQDVLDANAKKIDQYNALAHDIMSINEEIRVSWMSLAESSLIAMATAFGSGEPIGKAFLKSLASFGIKFGAMLIKLGIANIAIGNKPKGVQQIAAGVALVAAGAALASSSAASGGSGGGRGGVSDSGGGAGRGSVNANTQSEQRLVIQVVAKGNDLVGVYDSAKSSQVIRRGG